MICVMCRQAETVDGLISINLQRDEFRLMVNGVPARVCSSCGESYVNEEVVVLVLQSSENALTAGMFENVIEYNSLT
jgi:YgiT-type zinc finger domain-containing protein